MLVHYTADIEVAPINGEYLVLCQRGRTERHKQDTHVFIERPESADDVLQVPSAGMEINAGVGYHP